MTQRGQFRMAFDSSRLQALQARNINYRRRAESVDPLGATSYRGSDYFRVGPQLLGPLSE